MKVESLRNEAYHRIRAKLALGQLAAGSELSEPKLAEMLGISRTPVREALQQLEVEGLVLRNPKRRTIVRMPDRRDILDLYEVREAVEVFAAALAAERRTPTDLERLGYLCREMKGFAAELQESGAQTLSDAKLRRLLAADMGFHLMLIQATRNSYIMKIVADSHVLSRVFGAPRAKHDLKVVKENYQVHKGILAAVEASDGKKASELMARHIQSTLQETLEYFDSVENGVDNSAQQHSLNMLPEYLVDEFKRIGLTLKNPLCGE